MMKQVQMELLYQMIRIRRVEERIAKEYPAQEMRCPIHLSIGQEAIPAAFSLIQTADDYSVSTHRAHAHYLAKGGNLTRLIAELYGKEIGCSKGRGGSMHLVDLSVNFMGSTAIVGNTIPIGVGLGMSSKLRNKNQISFIFLGDGAIEEGVFSESANFAALHNLPIIFICENNLYSVYSQIKVRQPRNRSITQFANGLGLESIKGFGNNVEEVFNLLSSGVNKVRNGHGPIFFEFLTYRHVEHCGPNFDDDLNYRDPEELRYWFEHDPIQDYISKLKAEGLLTDFILKEYESKIASEIENSFLVAKKASFPEIQPSLSDVYAKS